MAAVLGVLKAGAAYVPMEPGLPEARLRLHATEDAGARLVLRPDADLDTRGANEPNPPRRAALDNLAYLIYTSGSTGLPKAVLLTHRQSGASFFRQPREQFPIRRIPMSGPCSTPTPFDFSVWEIWGALLHGGRLVVVSQATAVARSLYRAAPCTAGHGAQPDPQRVRTVEPLRGEFPTGHHDLCGL